MRLFGFIMMKNIILSLFICLLLICQCDILYSQDLNGQSVYKVTSYNLGAILGSQDNGVLKQPQNFKPLFITDTKTDILSNEYEQTISTGNASSRSTNINSMALSAQIEATDKMSIFGTFGVTRNLFTPELLGNENEPSWEANLGIIYRLLNNVSYELHLGYMDVGDLFTDRSSYADVENIIMISNQLTLSF
jgi:hypothetical protein